MIRRGKTMVRTERMIQWIAYSTVCVIGIVGAGCAAKTTPPSLLQARTTYAQAAQDSQITTHAPAELHEAEQSLSQAERVWENDHDEREVQHQTYMVERRVEIARARAEQKMAEQAIQQLSREREDILLKTREQEAQRSQLEAMQARAQAQLAQQQAEQARQQAEQAQQAQQLAAAQTAALEQQLSALRAKMQETSRGTVLTLSDVLFEVNQAALKPGALHNLYPLVTFLKDHPASHLVIEGHTDSTGAETYNRDLSQHRAEAVRDFLIQNGIEAERITAHGYGEAYPVASNDTQSGRQQNRRVEIVFPKE